MCLLPSKSKPSRRKQNVDLIAERNSLPESQEDRAIEAAVTREFSRFGTVFVKIRREARGNIIGMPYAFVQYTVSYPRLDSALRLLTNSRMTKMRSLPWKRAVES